MGLTGEREYMTRPAFKVLRLIKSIIGIVADVNRFSAGYLGAHYDSNDFNRIARR